MCVGLIHLFTCMPNAFHSWRELDSVWGVSERHAGSGDVCVNHSDAPQRNDGEEPEHNGEVSVIKTSFLSILNT